MVGISFRQCPPRFEIIVVRKLKEITLFSVTQFKLEKIIEICAKSRRNRQHILIRCNMELFQKENKVVLTLDRKGILNELVIISYRIV